MITGNDRKKFKELMRMHKNIETLMRMYIKEARFCFRDGERALNRGAEMEYKLFRHAGFICFNVAREIQGLLQPDQIPELRNSDFLQVFFKNFKRP